MGSGQRNQRHLRLYPRRGLVRTAAGRLQADAQRQGGFAGGYAAGYYSYKWAEVLDADAFSLFKQKGIFNQEVADSFRNNILSKGGTEHPMILYKRFRGQEPSIDALLIRNGIKK